MLYKWLYCPMSLVGSLRGVPGSPEPCNSNSNSNSNVPTTSSRDLFRPCVCPKTVQTSMPQQAIPTEDATERETTTGKQAADM